MLSWILASVLLALMVLWCARASCCCGVGGWVETGRNPCDIQGMRNKKQELGPPITVGQKIINISATVSQRQYVWEKHVILTRILH